MALTELYIKNMVCDRCIASVKGIAANLGLDVQHIELGKLVLNGGTLGSSMELLSDKLEEVGFELIDDDKTKTINHIKTIIIKNIHSTEQRQVQKNLSTILENEIGKDYSYLSKLFSSVEGRTIENYTILQKIERVKELLVYGEKTLSEIAFDLGYSSSQYLSNQFRQYTGFTPSEFKQQQKQNRKGIDKV